MDTAPFDLRRWAPPAVLLLAGLATAALWVGAGLPPAMDYPAHLALVEAARHLDEPGTLIAAAFEWGVFPAPNSLFYLLTLGLAPLLGTVTAGALVYGFAVAGFVWSFAWLAASFGRSPWLGLAAVPFAVQWPLVEGFVDYTLGLSAVMLATGLLRRYLDAPSRRRAALVAAASALVFFAHVQALLLYGVAALLLYTSYAPPRARAEWRPWLTRLAPVGLPVALLLAAWLLAADLDGQLAIGETKSPGLDTRLHQLWSKSVLFLKSSDDGALLVTAIACFGAVAALARPAPTASLTQRRADRTLALYALALLAIFLFAPLNIGYYTNLHSRTLALLAPVALLLLLPRALPRPPWRRRLAFAALAAPAVVAWGLWREPLSTWRDFTDGLVETLAAAAPDSHLLYVGERKRPTGFTPNLFHHLGQYHTVLNAGTTTFSFGHQRGRIVTERARDLVLESAQLKHLKHLDAYGCFDYVLQSGDTDLGPRTKGRLSLLARHGHWALYATGDRCRRYATWTGAGSNGGRPFRFECPDGLDLRGLRGTARDNGAMTSVRAVCGDDDGATALSPLRGHREGPAWSSECDGPAVGLSLAVDGTVRRARAVCRGNEPPPDAHLCPEGTHARALRGRSGHLVDLLAVGCAPAD